MARLRMITFDFHIEVSFNFPILSPSRPFYLGALEAEPDAKYLLESFVERRFAEPVGEAVECGWGEEGARFGVLHQHTYM